jgi:hypothetical protein
MTEEVEVEPFSNFKPTGWKYAAVITHDGNKIYALSVAVKKNSSVTGTVDSGTTTFNSAANLTEYQHALIAEGFTVQVTQYPSGHLQHAKDDALALAGGL